ncbi:MAG: response regulator transcription factor [Longimicrobiales bacterium]
MRGTVGRPRIAVVDDDAAVRAALERLLISMRFRTQTYASAEEFLTDGQAATFACVLLDVQLRGMSGIELTIYLAARHPELAIVLLTANPEVVARNAFASRMASSVLRKPVDADVLISAVENAVAVAAT